MFKSNYIYETSLQKQSKEDDYNGNNSNEQVRACVWDSNFHFSEKKSLKSIALKRWSIISCCRFCCCRHGDGNDNSMVQTEC